MRNLVLVCVAALLSACASVAPLPAANDLFHDELFVRPAAPIDPREALAFSEPMRQYLAKNILGGSRRHDDPRRQLFEALYEKGELRLEYDAGETRTAAQAFEARSGNCLALVMMTSAFAREMGLSVRYQVALDDDTWDRNQDTYISVGHVNLMIADRPYGMSGGYIYSEPMTIDFIPSPSAQRLRTHLVEERSIVAMYLNNRAVESLGEGHLDAAYWWAREAMVQDPQWSGAYLTLAVVYRMRQHPELAEAVLARVLEREGRNLKAMTNRVLVLRDLGRHDEANALAAQLARLDPHPPFSYFQEGMAAFREHRFKLARDLFAKEVGRAPYYHEFHFWLAMSYLELNDLDQATAHMAKAIQASTSRKDHDRYAVKLERLKTMGL